MAVRLDGDRLRVAFKDGAEQAISLAPLVARFPKNDGPSDEVPPADLTVEGLSPSRGGYRLVVDRMTIVRSSPVKPQGDIQSLSGTLLLRDPPPSTTH
jgi:hypothetical protein